MPDSLPARWSDPAVILVATDLSDLDRLMPHALQQASESNAHLVLLHVIAPDDTLQFDAPGTPNYDPAEATQLAQLSLDPWCKIAAALHLDCSTVVREGDPAQQISAALHTFHADRVLLGTRNPDKRRKLELGSVAEQVLRSVNIPVITVGPEAHLQEEAGDSPPVVLHATTLRETSRPGAVLACQIAARRHGRLVLLHVLPDTQQIRTNDQRLALDSETMQELDRLSHDTPAAQSIHIEPRVVHGNRLIEILATAAECQASLIVLGIAGQGAFDNLTREHAILQVLAHARCPVMILRNPCALTEVEPVPAAAAGRG